MIKRLLIITVALGALTSCSGPQQSPTSSEGGTSSTSQGRNSSIDEAPDTWDEALGGRSVEQLVQEQRALRRQGAEDGHMFLPPDADLDVPLIRIVSYAEWPHTMVDCFAEQGFTLHIEMGGGTIRAEEVPDEQGPALNYTNYYCEMSYPISPFTQVPLPKQAAEQLWLYWTGEAYECVKAHGFDPGEPPSKATWMESAVTQTVPSWSPFESVRAVGEETPEVTALYNACATYPEDFFPSE